MKSVVIECDISIHKHILDNESTQFLVQLLKNNTFLEKMASFFQDDLFIKNAIVESISIIEVSNSIKCSIVVNFNSGYTQRVIEKVMRDNFFHYQSSGGLCQYGNHEIVINFNSFNFQYSDEGEVLLNLIDRKRNCNVCGAKAYLYLYDKEHDLMNSMCIDDQEFNEFNIEDHLYPMIRGYLYKYKVTDLDHNILKEEYYNVLLAGA